nr:serine protease 55-like isoform X2 [Geotrypetes seraphini]
MEKSTQAAGKPYRLPKSKLTTSGVSEPPQKNWVLEKSNYLPETTTQNKKDTTHFHIFAPWQTLIMSCNNKICNGAILNKYWIVTTAGCAENMEPDDTAIYVGLNGPDHFGDVIKADRIFPHAGHDENVSVGNDIALILLEGPILFWKYVRPFSVTQSLNMDIKNVDRCGLAGLRWLESDTKPSSSDVNLAFTQLSVKNSVICPEDEALLKNIVFCIEEANNDHKLLKIQQGSAVLCTDKKHLNWTLIGILSKVLDESPMPAFTTRLAAYINWMNNVSEIAGRPLKLPVADQPPRRSSVPALQRSQAPSGLSLQLSLLFICLAASIQKNCGY